MIQGFRDGELRIPPPAEPGGIVGELAAALKQTADRNRHFADELNRVCREVVRQGHLDARLAAGPGQGAWSASVEAANALIDALVVPTANATRVLEAVADGDLTQRMDLQDGNRPLRGDMRRLARRINQMVDQLSLFTNEVTRLAREVGTDGRLGRRARIQGLSGTWRDVTEAVNTMADRLTAQVRDIAVVTKAVASGDLTRAVTVEATGELLELKSTVNTMVDQLSAFADEVTRVAREVGTEGRLGGRAQVRGVSGVWRDLTDNVNFMADNLTSQVRNIAQVTTSVANGDLSKKITVDAQGEILQLKSTVNTMVDQLSAFAGEVTRVAREVGAEGNLGGRAQVRGVSGVWRDLTDNVNFMADNLTSQVRNIAQVATAVAQGDLGKQIDVDARGEILELKTTINTMVDQLSAFAGEVTRVAREVGTDGNLGGQAQVRGVSGVWRDLTDNVNFMASNLTSQVRNIAQVTTSVANGDLSKKIDVDAQGEILELKSTVNTMVDQLSAFAGEVTRVARDVGTEGNLGGRAEVPSVSGMWKDLTDNVNFMADNLTSQVRNIAQVATAVAQGDLSKKIDVDARGEILELKSTINTMVDQLSAFAGEVTRVAREVGTEGNLGGQAQVRGVSGVWRDLTDNVNFMASNLTSQVRNIAQVTTSVANGDLSKKIDVDARGEILELKSTINTMVDQLSAFAGEVTRVAREVGSEGRLGGQARVEGARGTWNRLTTNVNELARNLTTQVRAIAEVTSAVAQGDMSRYITVETRGEVSELKDNINRMVSNLRETTRAKDWLESNLTRLAGLMQGHRDLVEVADLILRELTPLVNAQYGAFFLARAGGADQSSRPDGEVPDLALIAGYGLQGSTDMSEVMAQGLARQAASEQRRILVEEVPPEYLKVSSGLGEATPASIVIIPIRFEDKLLGVIELASFHRFSDVHLAFFDQFVNTIGVAINTILANARTEALLGESQSLAALLQERSDELQRQRAELQGSNEALEEKAAQLASSSQYKSEFLANMSHELRTPLSSLLIYARLLADNTPGHLSAEEVSFAKSIHRSGADLLQLINDILDLSKVEAGRLDLRLKKLPLAKLLDYVNTTFRPIAVDRGLAFEVDVSEDAPSEMHSDEQRLQQILRNLLSNAIKFTSEGHVRLRVKRPEDPGQALLEAEEAVAFTVEDTGVGIPGDKLAMIFEAFEQAPGAASHEYGGTGLGLSISRELAALLGGRIAVESEPDRGSTFTLYVPVIHPSRGRPEAAAPAHDVAAGPDSTKQQALVTDEEDAGHWSPEHDQGDQPLTVTPLAEWSAERAARMLSGKVLIVDDDIRIVIALTQLLGRVGLPAVYALNGQEGIEVLERNPDVSLVLMDIMMPVMDGYEAIRMIRRSPGYADLPIVVLSAKAVPGEREKALAAGANDYLQKPVVDVDRLLKVACDLLAPNTAGEGRQPAAGERRPEGSGHGPPAGAA